LFCNFSLSNNKYYKILWGGFRLLDFIDTIIKNIPICISFVALLISLKNYLDNTKEKAPDLKIIQNLWTKKPRFELINESSSKLDETPSPSYLMFIPSKFFYCFKNQETISNLVLTPISYDVITEQIVGNQTKDSIVTSYLPVNFFGKKGSRDMPIKKLETVDKVPFEVLIATYPFMVIISNVDYVYRGKIKNKIILSTSIVNKELSIKQYESIMEYFNDTADYLETKINGDESIYSTVNKKVKLLANEIFNANPGKRDDNLIKIIGGTEGGYGGVLKEINAIITPLDPLEQYYATKNEKNT
jgi:hypothetical protein